MIMRGEVELGHVDCVFGVCGTIACVPASLVTFLCSFMREVQVHIRKCCSHGALRPRERIPATGTGFIKFHFLLLAPGGGVSVVRSHSYDFLERLTFHRRFLEGSGRALNALGDPRMCASELSISIHPSTYLGLNIRSPLACLWGKSHSERRLDKLVICLFVEFR